MIARRAAEIGALTVNRKTGDLRHFVAAMLEAEDAPSAMFSELGWLKNLADLARVKRDFLSRIKIRPEPNENIEAWTTLLAAGPITRHEPNRLEIAGFASDRVIAPFILAETDIFSNENSERHRDPLELKADVRAFARLICLEEAEPPLSIGVFGGWGSGKSTFMEALEKAIAGLAKGQKDRAQNVKNSGSGFNTGNTPQFISNVVQVRFNAWHFADANLWASLTAEFFDQLRAGGFAGSGKAIHRKLVERVNDHVHSLNSEVATARRALVESEKALQERQKERDTAVAKARSDKSRLIGQTLVDAVTKSFNEHKSELTEMGRRTYYDDPSKDIGSFVDLAKSLQTFGGQFKGVLSYIRARGWRWGAIVLALPLLIATGFVIWPSDLTEGAYQLKALGLFGFLASAGTLARTVTPGMKLVGDLAKSTADFAKELDDKFAEEIKEVAKADEALQRAASEAQARRAAAERANKALARYIDPRAGISNPPRLLRFMLEDDPETRSLEKEIGLISRIRRLFQAVDEIVAEEKTKPVEARDPADARDPDVPDRIVIYIDDLDRCTPSQVYAVLQAVHLLLAFRLFVVVVGVDVEWVERALTKELAPSTATPEESRQLAIRYLEKIFQLPFWLQRLSTDGADGGSYARFVRLMVETEPAPAVRRHTTASLSSSSVRSGSLSLDNGAQSSNGSASAPIPEEQSQSRQDATGIEEALSTVRLTRREIEFLADDAIGILAGREPRTVKRFINIYRIIRARLDSAGRAAFLGQSGKPPEYPIVAALIALETSQPGETVSDFYKALNQTGLADVSQINLEPVAAAFKTAIDYREGAPVTVRECLALSTLVRRYSFNREL